MTKLFIELHKWTKNDWNLVYNSLHPFSFTNLFYDSKIKTIENNLAVLYIQDLHVFVH